MKYLIGFLLSAFFVTSCGTQKKVQRIGNAIAKKDTAQKVVVTPEEVIDSFSIVRNIISKVNSQRINYKTFTAKVKVEYQGKEEGDQAIVFIRMQKDSVIWISLTGALGIEGFRLLVTKDTVRLMNKLKKTISYKSISYLQELAEVPLDFYSLQDLIVGNPVFLDSTVASYRSTSNELQVLMIGKIFKHMITLDNKEFKVLHSKLDDTDPLRSRTCDINFTDYEKANNFYFSKDRNIVFAEKSRLEIHLDFKQYSFDEPQTFPFNIPKNYKLNQ